MLGEHPVNKTINEVWAQLGKQSKGALYLQELFIAIM
jgi:hypothetical protein